MDWKGPEVAYLGGNKWIFSAVAEHDVVITCQEEDKFVPVSTISLPAVGILEIPPGCTARTEEWIFPATTQGKSEAKLKALVAPVIDVSWTNTEKSTMVENIPQKHESTFNEMSELILRNTKATASNQMTKNEIGELVAETKAAAQSIKRGYPYELVAFIIAISSALVYLAYRYVKLHRRMSAHEIYDLPQAANTSAPETNNEEEHEV